MAEPSTGKSLEVDERAGRSAGASAATSWRLGQHALVDQHPAEAAADPLVLVVGSRQLGLGHEAVVQQDVGQLHGLPGPPARSHDYPDAGTARGEDHQMAYRLVTARLDEFSLGSDREPGRRQLGLRRRAHTPRSGLIRSRPAPGGRPGEASISSPGTATPPAAVQAAASGVGHGR